MKYLFSCFIIGIAAPFWMIGWIIGFMCATYQIGAEAASDFIDRNWLDS